MNIGSRMGRTIMSRYQVLFGFGAKTGIDLPGEETGILYSEENMDVSTLATNAFGQNCNVTMIQQIAAYCSVVNGGTDYEPQVVRQVKNSDGALVWENDGVVVRETVSESTAEYLKEALFDVVDIGTGKNAKIDGYEIWGKTGTAEKAGRDKTNYLLSFIGGVNPENPEFVLYVVVDSPHGMENQAQSKHASTLWREIMEDLLVYMNIYPTRELENPPAVTETDPVVTEPEAEEERVVYIDTEDDFSGGIFTEDEPAGDDNAGDDNAGDDNAGDDNAGAGDNPG
jgi:stage V sporulation protein D (sporulation-specific penicillin-binding protein)